jgi:protein-tyrosine phosphatase
MGENRDYHLGFNFESDEPTARYSASKGYRDTAYFSKITENLFLGPEPTAQDADTLRNLGIKNILSVAKECHDEWIGYEGKFNLVYVGMHDHSPLPPWLAKQALTTLREMLKRGKTLVHCGIGVSRSPTTIALYWYAIGETDSVAEGIQRLQKIRPCVAPNRIVDDNLMQMVFALRRRWAKGTTGIDSTPRVSTVVN